MNKAERIFESKKPDSTSELDPSFKSEVITHHDVGG